MTLPYACHQEGDGLNRPISMTESEDPGTASQPSTDVLTGLAFPQTLLEHQRQDCKNT